MKRRSKPETRAQPIPGGFKDGGQPLYVSLAKTLVRDIGKGRYGVGDALPTEDELAQRHDVSRHTVRQALRELKEEGLIWSRGGVGTIVRTRPGSPRFFTGINSISELLQFVDATQMHVVSRGEIVVDEAMAAQLRCHAGQAWSETNIVRKVPRGKLPLSYLQVYLRPEFADALGSAKILTQPIYSLVEARYGVRIVEVLQEITAANLKRDMARALQADEGQAALKITRCYLDRSGTIIEVGIGHYPSGRYTQSTRFRAPRAEADTERPAAPQRGRKVPGGRNAPG